MDREFIESHIWIRNNAPMWWRCIESIEIPDMIDVNRLRIVLDFLKLPRCDNHPKETIVGCAYMITILLSRRSFSSSLNKTKTIKPCCICGSNALRTISLRCGHQYHHSCLQSHSQFSLHCPICIYKFKLPKMPKGMYSFGNWGQMVKTSNSVGGIDSHFFVNYSGKVDTRVPVGPFNVMRDLLMYVRDKIERRNHSREKRIEQIMLITDSVIKTGTNNTQFNTLTRVSKTLIKTCNVTENDIYNLHELTVAEVLTTWLIFGHDEEYSELFVPFDHCYEISDFDSEYSVDIVNNTDSEVLITIEQYLSEISKKYFGKDSERWDALRDCIMGYSTGERINLIREFITIEELEPKKFIPTSFIVTEKTFSNKFIPFPTEPPSILAPMPSELLPHYNYVHETMTANFGKNWVKLPTNQLNIVDKVDNVLSMCKTLNKDSSRLSKLPECKRALLRHRILHAALRSKQ